MKKGLLLFLTVMLSVFLVTGCGNKDEEVLNIYNWGFYMDPEVMDEFTEETGIEIVYDEFPTNEDMYVKLKSGGSNYDLLFPSDYMIEKMINENMLLPINFDNIPNFSYIDPVLTNLSFDPENKYSVPYTWGTLGIVYDTERVSEPITSWSALWDEQYEGEILMTNSSRDALAIALVQLGYSINTHNVDELEEAKQLLLKQRPLVLAYVIDEVRDMMLSGEAVVAAVWSGEGIYLEEETGGRLKYVVPEEAGNVFVDAAVIPTTAQNQEWAEQFIDYINRPDIAARIAEYIGYATPNIGARDTMPQHIVNNINNYPDAKTMERLDFFEDPSDIISEYDRIWTEVTNE